MSTLNENQIESADVEAAKKTSSPPKKKFPTPQYLVTIYTRATVTVDRDNADERVEKAWRPYIIKKKDAAADPPPTEATRRRPVRVKMQSLLLKMLNRLVRERVIPAEAVSVLTGGAFVSIRLLVAPSAVPVIMVRCERIGVGNVSGSVWVCPLETSMMPPPSDKEEVDAFCLLNGQVTGDARVNGDGASGSGAKVLDQETTATAAMEADETRTFPVEEVDEVSDSDDDEEDDEAEKKSATGSIRLPLLSLEKKKKLQQNIIDARLEWKRTSSRVRVLQVIEEVTAGASFTFDYALFVFCAAFIAAIGLATDSGPTVIASMLVSPIMGPVMGMTFGTIIKSKKLVVAGMRNELISLLMCFAVGAFVCILAVVSDAPHRRNWPSREMVSRGDKFGLLSGTFVAIPSGVAVALSTLGKNSSGMVGVAISLSLLPPAVNAAMCWTYELMLLSGQYTKNDRDRIDYWNTGGVSFALTIINIICIWLAGTFTFWLKEVAPIKGKNAFWKNDIAVYRNNKGNEADIDVINEGIQAALELQNIVAEKDDLYKGASNYDLTGQRAAAERRHGLANNAVEDAFYVDNKGLQTASLVPGGAVGLDETKLQDASRDNTQRKEELMNNANKFGNLTDAGKALFDNDLLPSDIFKQNDGSYVQNDTGVLHRAVAEDVLLNGLNKGTE